MTKTSIEYKRRIVEVEKVAENWWNLLVAEREVACLDIFRRRLAFDVLAVSRRRLAVSRLYLDVVHVLSSVENCIFSKTSSEANSLLSGLTKYKLIQTAHLFLAVIEVIGPIFRSLQREWLDF